MLGWILIEISHHAIRGSTTFHQLYERVSKKHGRNAARVAVARKMLCIIYHMLIKKEVFKDKELENKNTKTKATNRKLSISG